MELGDLGAEGGDSEEPFSCYITATSVWGATGATEERRPQAHMRRTLTTIQTLQLAQHWQVNNIGY